MRWRLAPCVAMAIVLGGFPLAEARAGADPRIDAAVRRGVEFLKDRQNADGTWNGMFQDRLGAAALAGLALREAGVAEDDEVIRRVAAQVRTRTPDEMQTYDLALSIMFLDKLTRTDRTTELRADQATNPATKDLRSGRILVGQQVDDSQLIVTLGQRLAQGQGRRGTWSYTCGGPTDGDHSNTQFGVLGLWVAGQHGLNVSENMRRCAQHFRSCQNTDGGWGYAGSGPVTASMTAAGLIALATGEGMEVQLAASTDPQSGASGRAAPGRTQDASIQSGLQRLERFLGPLDAKAGKIGGDPLDFLAGGANPFGARGGADALAELNRRLGAITQGMGSARDLYTLWSIERVGVLYGLKSIGQVAWYPWGSPYLVDTQQQDGSWSYQGISTTVGTSFALLFLMRADVAPELSGMLSGKFGPEGTRMESVAPGTDPAQAFGAEGSIVELLEALGSASDPQRRRALLDELADRRPRYADVKDQVADVCRLAGSRNASVAQAARDQVANAFQRAPMSHSLYYLGEVDEPVGKLIWAQLDARIARAGAERRKAYAQSAVAVLGHKEMGTASRRAAIELLGKLDDRRSADEVADMLVDLPREIWPDAGALLGDLTGQDFGPHPGDGIAEALAAQEQWAAWLARNPSE